MSREALLGCAIGRKGVGKTFQTIQIMDKCVLGRPGVPPRKVLIFDVNNEFQHVKALDIKDVKKFSAHPKIEQRRVTIWKNENGVSKKMSLNEMAETLFFILENYSGGLLLIEDMTKYVSDSMPSDLIGSICTQRHTECDIIIHFQTIGKIGHPKIFGNLNWLRFHKIDDTVDRHESKFGGDVTNLKIIECLVNDKYMSGDQRFFAYLDKDSGKIRGNFTSVDFQKAVDTYLSKDPSVIKKELNRMNLDTGGKLYSDAKSVIDEIRKQCYSQYYGN